MSPNDNLFYDIWFRGLKTAEESITEGVDYCGPVKKTQKVFLLYHW